jgi:hypothetical protein
MPTLPPAVRITKPRVAGHPCSVPSRGGIHRYRHIRKYTFKDGFRFYVRELERPLSQEGSITVCVGKKTGEIPTRTLQLPNYYVARTFNIQ